MPSRNDHTLAVPSFEEEMSSVLAGGIARSVISPECPRSVCCSNPLGADDKENAGDVYEEWRVTYGQHGFE